MKNNSIHGSHGPSGWLQQIEKYVNRWQDLLTSIGGGVDEQGQRSVPLWPSVCRKGYHLAVFFDKVRYILYHIDYRESLLSDRA